MDKNEILRWLRETDEQRLEPLWVMADSLRQMHVGDAVHLRGLVEISNHCARECAYCGIRKPNRKLVRYRMTEDEIIECAHHAEKLGYGTIVLQSGEDYSIEGKQFSKVIRRIKNETNLAVTLALGERENEDFIEWKKAGADRYLLKFETSDRRLYEKIHPMLNGRKSNRIEMLKILKEIGYETGSGVMIGIPGQTIESLADDIELFHELDLDMIGVGPYIPHPDTPLRARLEEAGADAYSPLTDATPAVSDAERNTNNDKRLPDAQSPLLSMTYKMIALTRIACPEANIPATTALATLNPNNGYENGLRRGANVIMPNLTPVKYKSFYDIYPSSARKDTGTTDYHENLRNRIAAIGRKAGTGRGDSIRSGKV